MEMYQTNAIDLFSALYHLTYENENDINQILKIEEIETIKQIAIFERKTNFKCKLKLNKYTDTEKVIIQMFDFQHSHLTYKQFEKIVTITLVKNESKTERTQEMLTLKNKESVKYQYT